MNTVLFEDGDWRICQYSQGDDPGSSHIYHRCHFAGSPSWWGISAEAQCGWCVIAVPEPILGLWRLHNWNR